MSDNVRVSIQWKNNTVFAGEAIECTITFTNTSQPRRSPSPHTRGNGSMRDRWKDNLSSSVIHNASKHPLQRSSSAITSLQAAARGHKMSLSAGEANGNSKYPPVPGDGVSVSKALSSEDKSHRRSVSIVSLGGDTVEAPSARGPPLRQRPGQFHTRAASLQILPKRSGFPSPKTSLASFNDRAFSVPSPLAGTTIFSEQDDNAQRSASSKFQQKSPSTHAPAEKGQDQFAAFRFPSAERQSDSSAIDANPKTSSSLRRALSPQPMDRAQPFEQLNPITRILSPGSMNGTPRSSGEFYSQSNNSTETLGSEYVTPETSRMLRRPVHNRQISLLAPVKTPKVELLLMGFGQINGSFTLDGSLVNQAPFEEVKKKGIVGGQGGGGLVRSQSTKRDSGILGSFGWGNFGEAFGGLLGDNGMSSIKEAKKINGNKSIPILSAPQSILFVDLKLAPGESRSFYFSHPLPRGLPPSHRGKAIKINYSLVVGTQHAARLAQQSHMQRVEVPFKVLPCINAQGDVLGHDLMSPYIFLSNNAIVSSHQSANSSTSFTPTPKTTSKSTSSSANFSSYVEKLLEHSQHATSSGLLSPSVEETMSFPHNLDEPSSMKECIDLALLKRNAVNSSKRNVNRFEINRNGEKVAVAILSRPAYRLGETIPIVIDLNDADVACYSVHATLETSESVDPVVALRSKASVQRVTRRIHASQYESTISSQRVLFNLMIPSNATPEFITTGVNMEWNLRFEFVTSRVDIANESNEDSEGIMEELSRDERGTIKAAVQSLLCETFDVSVPLRIYGAIAAFDENLDSGSFPI